MTTPMSPSDYFDALDRLQESGIMNMFGAPQWLQDVYDIPKTEARKVFKDWIEYRNGKGNSE